MIVACSQYMSRDIHSVAEFEAHVKAHLEQAHQQGAELILFPEFLGAELLTLEKDTPMDTADKMEALFRDYAVKYTEYLENLFTAHAKHYNMAIVAGTHFWYEADSGKYRNTAFAYLPNGVIFRQHKIHRAIEMVYNRHMMIPGDEIGVFEYKGAKICINVCYDNSFGESAHIARTLGADIILSPVCAFDEYGKNEQALFTRARASENFLFVINAQMTGQISFPYHIPYGSTFSGRSGIYAPIHPAIGQIDGVVAQAKDAADEVLVAEINIDRLHQLRADRSVGVLIDRRDEVYQKYLKH